MKLVNLTPHPIVLRAVRGAETIINPSGVVARVDQTTGYQMEIPGSPVPVFSAPKMGEIIGLRSPDPVGEDLELWIVSAIVGQVWAARIWPHWLPNVRVVCPGTGPQDGAIRNEKGQIIAVTRLIAM